MKFLWYLLFIIGTFITYAACFIPSAIIANALWAAIIVPIFNLPSLTFWQMYGLLWLVRFIIPINVSKMEIE